MAKAQALRVIKVSGNSRSVEEARAQVFDFFKLACRSLHAVMDIYNLNGLKNLKAELALLLVAKVTGGAPNKLSKFKVVDCTGLDCDFMEFLLLENQSNLVEAVISGNLIDGGGGGTGGRIVVAGDKGMLHFFFTMHRSLKK
ncbi:hypothetical protein SADUNF_Sadunf16G0065500 [Salix dunnii]|uniref:Uncharacterized protein n=1 Tax=Salix dunnii TaxID=1413687 RepID=A0A835MG74_9ROSI|nr:hypothetical protein SADUNF_Sadunf16G0065500 [Salix dunnii]